MTPLIFLLLLIAVTLAALGVQRLVQHRRRQALRTLGRQCGLHYLRNDRFRLTPRVVAAFPVPGAAVVRVIDLLYGRREDVHQYCFTIEYTVGALSAQSRKRQVGCLRESRAHNVPSQSGELMLGAPEQPIIEQYRQLCASQSEK